jgi:hypothetical protein
MKYLHLIAIFSLFTSFASAQVALWGKTEEGMSPNQVLELYPNAVKNTEKEYYPDYNGSWGLIVIKKNLIPIDMYSYYRVKFYFSDSGLQKVSLTSLSASTTQKKELVRLLSQKFGLPTLEESFGDLIRKEWYKNGTDVRFEYTNRNGDNPEIGIQYMADRTGKMLQENL